MNIRQTPYDRGIELWLSKPLKYDACGNGESHDVLGHLRQRYPRLDQFLNTAVATAITAHNRFA